MKKKSKEQLWEEIVGPYDESAAAPYYFCILGGVILGIILCHL